MYLRVLLTTFYSSWLIVFIIFFWRGGTLCTRRKAPTFELSSCQNVSVTNQICWLQILSWELLFYRLSGLPLIRYSKSLCFAVTYPRVLVQKLREQWGGWQWLCAGHPLWLLTQDWILWEQLKFRCMSRPSPCVQGLGCEPRGPRFWYH